MATIAELTCCLDKAERRIEALENASLTGYLVDNLSLSATKGDRAYVTNAVANTYGINPTGGGSTFAPVVFTGTDWIIG